MILWLSAALASTTLVPCDIFQPIAGTAGWENARAATRVTADTYGAGAFARKRLRGKTLLAFDMHVVAGVTKVPSWCTDTEGRIAQEIYLQPVDLGATNIGLQVPVLEDGPLNSTFRLFYASSVTQTTTMPRVLSWTTPLFNLYPALSAPLLGRAGSFRGVDAYTVDWIGGGTFRSDVISVQSGYTGSNGLYVDVTQEKIALFGNSVLRNPAKLDTAYLMAGLQGLDPDALGLLPDVVGLTSLFYRDLPLTDLSKQERDDRAAKGGLNSLKTGHFRQEDVMGLFDLRAAWQLGAQQRLHELAVAAHTAGWNRGESEKDGALYGRLGVVNLPDIPTMGVRGGVRPTVRVDAAIFRENTLNYRTRLSLRVNDPDVLALYPFAYNAVSFNIEISGAVEEWDE